LEQQFLLPLGMKPSTLAGATGVPAEVIGAIIAGNAGTSNDIAALLAAHLTRHQHSGLICSDNTRIAKRDLAELTAEAQRLGLGY
jgi:hypothetical protein